MTSLRDDDEDDKLGDLIKDQPSPMAKERHESGVEPPADSRQERSPAEALSERTGVGPPPGESNVEGATDLTSDPRYMEPFGPGDREAARWNTELEAIKAHDGHSRATVAAEMGWAAERIGHGHAFSKHGDQFEAVESPEDLSQLATDIIGRNEPEALANGRLGYWDEREQAVVVIDPDSRTADLGTVFKPKDGKLYFQRLKGAA